MEMNNIPWSPVLRYATPLPMNRTPVSTVALQHKSVSSVLRYATPLPINRTPFRPYAIEHKSVSSVLRYARPFPMNKTPFRPYVVEQKARFLHPAVRQTSFRLFRPNQLAPDEHDIFRYLPMNTTQFLGSDPAGWLSMNRTPLLPSVASPCTRDLAIRMRK